MFLIDHKSKAMRGLASLNLKNRIKKLCKLGQPY